jgi:hypothetical protein
MKFFIETEKETNIVKNVFSWHNDDDLPENYIIPEDEQIITTENEQIYEEYLQRQGQNKKFKLIDINKNTFDEMFKEQVEAEPEARMDLNEEIRIIREAVYQIIQESQTQNVSEFENYYSKINNK